MKKWFGLLFFFLLIGCEHDTMLDTPTAVTFTPQPPAIEFNSLPTETAVTPTRHPTTTATSTPTITPIATYATPTMMPPITAEPEAPAAQYQLRPWSDEAAAAHVALITDFANQFGADSLQTGYFGDQGRRQILMAGQEFRLRYPDSPYQTDVAWQMVDALAYYPSFGLYDLLTNQLATDLNNGLATLENLDAYLEPHGLKQTREICSPCYALPTSVPNLLGDGREVTLILLQRLSSQYDGAALIAVWQNENSTFMVEPVLSQWFAMQRFSGGITNFEARYITGDFQPELIVETWDHSGSMQGSSLHMLRWNGSQFEPLSGTPVNLNRSIISDEWEFIDDDNPSRLKVVRSTFDSTETQIYGWINDSYQVIEAVWVPVPYPMEPTPSLEWVRQMTEARNHSEVIAYLTTYLTDAIEADAKDEADLFQVELWSEMRFILGMNYVYSEDEENARAVFETLRDESLLPASPGFSQAANAFLERYDGRSSGAYMGCLAAYRILQTAESEFQDARNQMPLCSINLLLLQELPHFNGINASANNSFANEIIDVQQLELNGDGTLDWLLFLYDPFYVYDEGRDIWVILTTSTGTEAVKLASFRHTYGEQLQTIIQTHPFPLLSTPLLGIISNENAGLYQLVQDDGIWQAKLHPYVINGHYDLKMTEGRLQLEVTYNDHYRLDSITYEWQNGEFVEIGYHAPNSLGIPFDEAFTLAETLIFEEQDYATAVSILTVIANELDTDDWRARRLPEMLYFLGLAHELQGQEDEAVAAYWQLWHDYPTDPYALMAAAKLERQE